MAIYLNKDKNPEIEDIFFNSLIRRYHLEVEKKDFRRASNIVIALIVDYPANDDVFNLCKNNLPLEIDLKKIIPKRIKRAIALDYFKGVKSLSKIFFDLYPREKLKLKESDSKLIQKLLIKGDSQDA